MEGHTTNIEAVSGEGSDKTFTNVSYYDYYGISPYIYDDYYEYQHYDYSTVYYKTLSFERPIYLYVWTILILLTLIANTLVILIFSKRYMRNSTNIFLVAIAISDTLTGIVTLPVTIYAYSHYTQGYLSLTKEWCRAFMMVRYFALRSFHTASIWLTVLLALQRLIYVTLPFRAQSMFTVRKTWISILVTAAVSPILHIYHVFKSKVSEVGGMCEWVLEIPCQESCAFLALETLLMHLLPCVFLLVVTVKMILVLRKNQRRMSECSIVSSISNSQRSAKSRQISIIVLTVVIVFMVPELPYAVFLAVITMLQLLNKRLLSLKTNRSVICAYEMLMVVTFQSNFWIYLTMNRSFRRSLCHKFDPIIGFVNGVLKRLSVRHRIIRQRSSLTSSNVQSTSSEQKSNMGHSPLRQTTTLVSATSQSVLENNIEMKTYEFNGDENSK